MKKGKSLKTDAIQPKKGVSQRVVAKKPFYVIIQYSLTYTLFEKYTCISLFFIRVLMGVTCKRKMSDLHFNCHDMLYAFFHLYDKWILDVTQFI